MITSLKNNKKLSVLILIVTVTILLTLFLPTLYSKSYAEDKLGIEVETYTKSLFSPEYIGYIEGGEDGSLIYIKLGRKLILGWQVVDQKEQIGDVDKLKKSIEEGTLIPDDLDGGIDLEAIERNSTSPNYDPGSVSTSIDTLEGDKIEVILGDNQQDNGLQINGAITGIQNVYSVSISLDEKYLYYTKFASETLDDGFIITTADGKIYKYDLNNKSESIIYSFNAKLSFSFMVNNDYIFYANEQDEVGTIDLLTKEKSIFDTSKLGLDLAVEDYGDIGEYTPFSVINIDERYGILEVGLPDKDAEYFSIKLVDLSI